MELLTLDVGGTLIKYAWMSDQGEIKSQGNIPTPYENQEAFLSCIQELWDDHPTEKQGIAISLPGTIDSHSGYVFQGGSLTYNSKTNLKELLEVRLHTSVSIENDARCAALCELHMGNMKDVQQGIVLTFGTGVGGCFIINGEVYKGSHLFSGEVSMLICKDLSTYGMNAVFGNIASVPGLVKQIAEAKKQEVSDGRIVFDWIAQQDEIALTIFQGYCQSVVTQLFNLQLILDPQRVCLGGGVSQNPVFMNGIKQAMNVFYDRLPVGIPRLDLQPCKYHNDANLYGAYHHFITQNHNENTK